MDLSPRTSVFGPHEFLVRRLHSLLGLIPVGAYLVVHLFTNASILDGPIAYQGRVDQIQSLGETTILFAEWTLIFLPLLFHGVVGMLIVARGERNLSHYRYGANIRYTLQRFTGVILFVFVLWHVFHMQGWFRFPWWRIYVAEPLGAAQFDPARAAASAAAAIRSSPFMIGFYVVGVLAAVYHLADGLWTMGITWGVWTAPKAQRWAGVPCALVGLVLGVAGFGSLYGLGRVPIEKTSAPSSPSVSSAAPAAAPTRPPDSLP